MSFLQRFFTAIFPRSWAKSMEADSRSWIIHCSHCGHERSIWDIGGIRWKSYGNPPRSYMRCPSCGKRSWHQVEHRTT
jgi:hypothetical protein